MKQSVFQRMSIFRARAMRNKSVSILGIIIIIAGVYGLYAHTTSSSSATKYILTTVTKGTLVSTVSGSGQVAAENQTTVTSAVPGTIMFIAVSDGDMVTSGQLLASIESSDAERAVNTAELSLENTKVAYDKAVKQANDQVETSSSSDVAKAYQNGYNAIVATSIDLPTIFSGLDSIYYTPSHSPYFTDMNMSMSVGDTAVVYKNQAGADFDSARALYQANFLRYKNISINSSPEEIVSLLNDTNTILKKLLGALSGTYSTMDYVQNKMSKIPAELTTDKASVSSYVTKVNSDSASVTSALTSIDDAKTSGTTANLEMKSAKLAVAQAEAALSDAQKARANHQIRAPFNGIVAKVIARQGDTASNGTQIATLVTEQKIVTISLNEIDAAKVSKGDKVTLTFDAIDGLTLAGHVKNVDIVGAVSQGVVTYTVEIAFDDIDARVKPGMTVNANIITTVKHDVLLVPSSAVKTQAGTTFVLAFDQIYTETEALQGIVYTTIPRSVPVTIGISNDSLVEIISGLSEGEQIVSRTTTAATKTSTTPSILNSIGGSRAGATAGNTFRATISR